MKTFIKIMSILLYLFFVTNCTIEMILNNKISDVSVGSIVCISITSIVLSLRLYNILLKE